MPYLPFLNGRMVEVSDEQFNRYDLVPENGKIAYVGTILRERLVRTCADPWMELEQTAKYIHTEKKEEIVK